MRTLNPITLILYFLVLAAMAMSLTNPLYLALIFLITLSGLFSLNAFSKLKNYFWFSLTSAAFIVAINVLVCRNGQTVLFESIPIFMYGKWTITLEALLFGLMMSAKLMLVLNIFCFYEAASDSDRTFSFFAKLAPKSALITLLSSMMIPQMKQRLENISLIMQMRGATINEKGIVNKIKSHYPLLKILLLSSLEGSWETAEALHARGFGTGPRTNYSKETWKGKDTLISISSLFGLAGFIACLWFKKGFLTFYPAIGNIFELNDILFLSWIGIAFGIPILICLLDPPTHSSLCSSFAQGGSTLQINGEQVERVEP